MQPVVGSSSASSSLLIRIKLGNNVSMKEDASFSETKEYCVNTVEIAVESIMMEYQNYLFET